MTMKLIQHQELTSSQWYIGFSSIPQTYTDLYLVISSRSSRSNIEDSLMIEFNEVSSYGGSYNVRRLAAVSGDTPFSNTLNIGTIGYTLGNTGTSNTFGNTSLYIPNYTGSANKAFTADSSYGDNSLGVQTITAGLWTNTSAINSITLFLNSFYDFMPYTSVSLFGITKGTDGVTTVL